MRICEIFKSINGEGRLMGRLCLFVRLSGCNLRCSTCDTAYAWNEGFEMDVDGLTERVLNANVRWLVVTGGEPLLQVDEVVELLKKVKGKVKVSIETNGTLFDGRLVGLVDLFNVSPKRTAVKFDVLRKWADVDVADFKFVVGKSDWTWRFYELIDVVVMLGLNKDRVWIMCENGSERDFVRRAWEFCVDYGFNFSGRLHVDVWGVVRGK